jgi:hypothetical protein
MDAREPTTERLAGEAEGERGAEDPVVAEVRAAREALFAEAHFDFEELGRLLRERQAEAGREAVVLPPRQPEPPSRAA